MLIELDPDAGSDGENEQSSPSEPCDRSTQTEEVKPGSRGRRGVLNDFARHRRSATLTATLAGVIL